VTDVDPCNDSGAVRLVAGECTALYLPAHGMLCASLARRGVEYLRRIDDLAAAASTGATAGIPLLHPWANRLGGPDYRAAGRDVSLDAASSLLHYDANGLPIHGVPWSHLRWHVIASGSSHVNARLEWTDAEMLQVFPFPHRLDMSVSLDPDGLTVATTLVAGEEGPVPVCFGFHPYFGITGTPRALWRLALPPLRRLELDARGLPTGADKVVPESEAPLGDRVLDDAYALLGAGARLGISSGTRRVVIEFLHGFRYAQIYAPVDGDCVALEPMTAPTAALSSGRGLTMVEAGQRYDAAFRVAVA
jgi:galactose mutarotase-like enzyme